MVKNSHYWWHNGGRVNAWIHRDGQRENAHWRLGGRDTLVDVGGAVQVRVVDVGPTRLAKIPFHCFWAPAVGELQHT